jgi:hypothetical protein
VLARCQLDAGGEKAGQCLAAAGGGNQQPIALARFSMRQHGKLMGAGLQPRAANQSAILCVQLMPWRSGLDGAPPTQLKGHVVCHIPSPVTHALGPAHRGADRALQRLGATDRRGQHGGHGAVAGPHYIGAVAVGALIFAFLFWGFGFLRLSTGGLSAQATGAGDRPALVTLLVRSLMLGRWGSAFVSCWRVIRGEVAVDLVGWQRKGDGGSANLFQLSHLGGTCGLTNFAIMGWFIGQGKARRPSWCSSFSISPTWR